MEHKELREVILEDLASNLKEKFSEDVIKSAVESIRATSSSKPATGSIMSMIFYLQINIDCDGRHFSSDVGGASSPGGGALIGDIYSDDFDKLFKNTNNIQFTATPVYTSVVFFDSESKALGTFQAGSVSTVAGIGGGTGKWTQPDDTFPLTLDNKHGGTYIAHGELSYNVGTVAHSETNKSSGGLSSTIQVPKNATNLCYKIKYDASSVENVFNWPSITQGINIEIHGVWPSSPSASWTQGNAAFPLTLDNKHGGTYIAHGELSYNVGSIGHSEKNKSTGGMSSSIQVPKDATDLHYKVTYTASSAENKFNWPSITQGINIEIRGVWPGKPSAKQA